VTALTARIAFRKATAAPQHSFPLATAVAWATAHGYLKCRLPQRCFDGRCNHECFPFKPQDIRRRPSLLGQNPLTSAAITAECHLPQPRAGESASGRAFQRLHRANMVSSRRNVRLDQCTTTNLRAFTGGSLHEPLRLRDFGQLSLYPSSIMWSYIRRGGMPRALAMRCSAEFNRDHRQQGRCCT